MKTKEIERLETYAFRRGDYVLRVERVTLMQLETEAFFVHRMGYPFAVAECAIRADAARAAYALARAFPVRGKAK